MPRLAGSVLGGLAAAALARLWISSLFIGGHLLAWIDGLSLEAAARAPVRSGGPPGPAPVRLQIAVGLATAGRPAIVGETLMRIARQTRPPDVVLVCAPTEADVSRDVLASDRPDFPATEILFGARGLTRQRNAILDRVPDADIICFFDDDFVPDPDYLAALERAFLLDQTLVGATGAVIADGITGPGYSFAEADALLAQRSRTDTAAATPVYNAYGCNMAFRLRHIRAANLRFDERLPRYGWLEDVDFSRRAARFGTLARIEGAVGVHLGTKGGRQSGLCFGYSQIANPVHLVRKGSYAWPRAAWLMSRNLGMNLARASTPEPHIDRRGRVAGNFAALRDLLRGRLDPERIEGLS